MVIYVDIDNTICSTLDVSDYSSSKPIMENIAKVNSLYDQGHTIVYWTARGSVSGKDFTELTKQQLEQWGVKYHEVKLGKPAYDMFVDDKAINSDNFFGFFNRELL